ncbi:MAG: hypothetical protein U0R19_31060 [Bryobacteraceae bacterium]
MAERGPPSPDRFCLTGRHLMEFTNSSQSQQTTTTRQTPAPRQVQETCGCESGLWPEVLCTACQEVFCRRCLLDHGCRCSVHGDKLAFFCHKCQHFGCFLCCSITHTCACTDNKKHPGVAGPYVPCQTCARLYCKLCEPNHVCLCDCGSGRKLVDCEICEKVYCSACNTRRHDCDCEHDAHGPEAVELICSWDGGSFYCAACFADHECCCACETVPVEGHAHCRICCLPFCEQCVSTNHKCQCGYCGETATHRMCQLCNRLFCRSCIDTHPCACEAPGCKKRGYSPSDKRQFCFDCLSLYCTTCYPRHKCGPRCACLNPVRYRCACQVGLCEKCVQTHECETMRARRILSEYKNTSNLASFSKPVAPCSQQAPCEFTARVGTWNMNHLSATTTETKKKLKRDSIAAVCAGSSGPLDVLALQEINSTATGQLNGLPQGVKVLHWGPLLQSQSTLTRLEFHKQFNPSTWKKPKEGEELDEKAQRKAQFFQAIRDGKLSKDLKAWRTAIDDNRTILSGNSEKEKAVVYQELKKSHPKIEALYEKFAGTKFRYQEYYPLVGVPSTNLTVHPKVDLYLPNDTVSGLSEGDAFVFRGKDEDLEFRPIVVYRLTKFCPAKGCTGLKFNLGVVHTSPEQGTSEFNRLRIYQHQLKAVLDRIVSEGGLWVVVGDYYLTAETIVAYPEKKQSTRSRASKAEFENFIVDDDDGQKNSNSSRAPKQRRKSSTQRLPPHINRDRNDPSLKINFEQQIPPSLEIVASASATNHPTWKPKYDPFNSIRAQVADFGICSRDWPIKGAYPIDPDNGSVLAVDCDSRAFQLMKTDDTSDHSPVLIYLAKNPVKASEEIRSMLGYSESSDKQAKQTTTGYQQAKSEAVSEREQELRETCKELEVQLTQMGSGDLDYVELVQKYRAALQTLLRLIAPATKLDTLDFVPSELC